MIVSILLGCLLLLVLLGQVARQWGGGGSGLQRRAGSGRILEEVLIEDHLAKNKIVVLDISGIITSQAWDNSGNNLVSLVEDQLRLAGEDEQVKAVILKVDSPGGEVLASDNIYREVMKFQETHGKPVVASMGGLAASGGYYVAAPCQWIVANPLTITGSIGVIMHGYNYRDLMDKVGVKPMVFKSGRFKDMMSGSKKEEEITETERAMIQDMVDETFERFKSVVAEGRGYAHEQNGGEGQALADNWEEYADGRIFSGEKAFEHGFVDELGTFETAVARAKELAGVSSANLIGYRQPFSLSQMLRLFGQSESGAVKVDWGIDLPPVEAGRPYFLWLPQ